MLHRRIHLLHLVNNEDETFVDVRQPQAPGRFNVAKVKR